MQFYKGDDPEKRLNSVVTDSILGRLSIGLGIACTVVNFAPGISLPMHSGHSGPIVGEPNYIESDYCQADFDGQLGGLEKQLTQTGKVRVKVLAKKIVAAELDGPTVQEVKVRDSQAKEGGSITDPIVLVCDSNPDQKAYIGVNASGMDVDGSVSKSLIYSDSAKYNHADTEIKTINVRAPAGVMKGLIGPDGMQYGIIDG